MSFIVDQFSPAVRIEVDELVLLLAEVGGAALGLVLLVVPVRDDAEASTVRTLLGGEDLGCRETFCALFNQIIKTLFQSIMMPPT